MFILDHNFGTRKARKSIKGWKDLDSSLKHFGLAVVP